MILSVIYIIPNNAAVAVKMIQIIDAGSKNFQPKFIN